MVFQNRIPTTAFSKSSHVQNNSYTLNSQKFVIYHCWRLLNTTIMPTIPALNNLEMIINTRIGLYTEKFHKCWSFLPLFARHSEIRTKWCNWEQANQWLTKGIIINILKCQIGLHHCDGLVEMIKTDISFAYIRAPDERYALDIMWTRWDPH
jgi:hypothetical protein